MPRVLCPSYLSLFSFLLGFASPSPIYSRIVSRAHHGPYFLSYALQTPATTIAEPIGSLAFAYQIAISVLLVLVGGAMAGLTIALMGLDELHLRVLATSSDNEKEKNNAQKVLNLLQKGRHWVLVVLLLANVIVNESLPIFLDGAIGGGVAAIVISTTSIVIFGVIPQALSVRYGLAIGAACAPFVLALMYILAPIAYPIARLLDRVLGSSHGRQTYKKAQLKCLLSLHRCAQLPAGEAGAVADADGLSDEEISILNGVLELNKKGLEGIMTPMKDVVTLSADTILDHKMVDYILSSGYSRFPVHEPGRPLAFVGLLLIKKLLKYDPAQALPVSHFKLLVLPEALPSIDCFQALDYFQTGRAHLLLISRTPGRERGAIGIVTLEDIIEEIISDEIFDETDYYEDNQSKRVVSRFSSNTSMRGIVEWEQRSAVNVPVTERAPLLTPPYDSDDSHSSYGAVIDRTP